MKSENGKINIKNINTNFNNLNLNLKQEKSFNKQKQEMNDISKHQHKSNMISNLNNTQNNQNDIKNIGSFSLGQTTHTGTGSIQEIYNNIYNFYGNHNSNTNQPFTGSNSNKKQIKTGLTSVDGLINALNEKNEQIKYLLSENSFLRNRLNSKCKDTNEIKEKSKEKVFCLNNEFSNSYMNLLSKNIPDVNNTNNNFNLTHSNLNSNSNNSNHNRKISEKPKGKIIIKNTTLIGNNHLNPITYNKPTSPINSSKTNDFLKVKYDFTKDSKLKYLITDKESKENKENKLYSNEDNKAKDLLEEREVLNVSSMRNTNEEFYMNSHMNQHTQRPSSVTIKSTQKYNIEKSSFNNINLDLNKILNRTSSLYKNMFNYIES